MSPRPPLPSSVAGFIPIPIAYSSTATHILYARAHTGTKNSRGKGKAKESVNTGAVGNRETSTHSTSSSSKRRRITPSSPLTSPPGSPHHFSQDLPGFPTANEVDLDLVALPGPVAELATPDADVEHAQPLELVCADSLDLVDIHVFPATDLEELYT